MSSTPLFAGLLHGTARATWLAGLACLLAGAPAQAQVVYRIVGPDGRITFSDKPPANAEQGKIAATGLGAAASASGGALPFELRQAASKYPVTLYTAPDCGPCASGRSLLSSRGIPFAERTVTTADDMASLKRISGEASIPVLTIGAQRLRGFSEVEWSQYLDMAGYPKTSMLPPGYRQAPATPLVSLVEKPPAPKPEPKVEAPPEAPVGPAPSNPAGIQF